MQTQIRGMNQAMRNIQDATSLLRVADAGMSEIQNMVQRIRELVVYAANDTNTIYDRENIQAEINQLISAVDFIANRTQFNDRTLLTGRYAQPLSHNAAWASGVAISASQLLSTAQGASGTAQVSSFSGSHSVARTLPTVDPNYNRTIDINQLHNNAATVSGDGWVFEWSNSAGRGTLRITESSATDGMGAFHIIGAVGGPSGSNGAAVGGGGDGNSAGANLTISGGLLEVLSGRLGGGWAGSPRGTVHFIDGNLSVPSPGSNGNTTFRNQSGSATQTEVRLRDIDTGDHIQFGAHEQIQFYVNVGGTYLQINSTTDSQGRAFIYVPSGLNISGIMVRNGDDFVGNLTTQTNHDGILWLEGQRTPDPPPDPIAMLPPPTVTRHNRS